MCGIELAMALLSVVAYRKQLTRYRVIRRVANWKTQIRQRIEARNRRRHCQQSKMHEEEVAWSPSDEDFWT